MTHIFRYRILPAGPGFGEPIIHPDGTEYEVVLSSDVLDTGQFAQVRARPTPTSAMSSAGLCFVSLDGRAVIYQPDNPVQIDITGVTEIVGWYEWIGIDDGLPHATFARVLSFSLSTGEFVDYQCLETTAQTVSISIPVVRGRSESVAISSVAGAATMFGGRSADVLVDAEVIYFCGEGNAAFDRTPTGAATGQQPIHSNVEANVGGMLDTHGANMIVRVDRRTNALILATYAIESSESPGLDLDEYPVDQEWPRNPLPTDSHEQPLQMTRHASDQLRWTLQRFGGLLRDSSEGPDR